MPAGSASRAGLAALPAALSLMALPDFVSIAAGQSKIFAANLTSPIQETYDEKADVSGSPVVGLRLVPGGSDTSDDTVDPDGLLVFWPQGESGELCVRSVTQDGRFSATATYSVGSSREGGYARLRPATQSHRSALSKYPVSELALRAFAASAGSGCSTSEADHLPLVTALDTADPQLELLVNSRSQHGTARLVDAIEGTELAEADCRRTGETSLIAFDVVCRFDLPDPAPERVTVVLSLNDGFSDTEYRVRVLVPGTSS